MKADVILPLAIDLSLKSGAIVVIALMILRAWTKASAAQRGWVWSLVFAMLLALPFTRQIAPHWIFLLPGTHPAIVAHDLPAQVTSSEISLPPLDSPIGHPQRPSLWSRLDAISMIAIVWAFGAALLVVYRLAGVFLLHRRFRASSSLQDHETDFAARAIASSYGITRPIKLRLSAECPVPMTWGIWRPVVALPGEALHWPPEWRESALRHELGHVKNFDLLKRWITFLVCSFYWPNPLVWLAARQFHTAQEEASDNLVLEAGVAPRDYAAQLIEVIRASTQRTGIPLPAVAMARTSTLEGRLSSILDETRNRANPSRPMAITGIAMTVVLSATLGAAQLRASDSPPQDSGASPTTETNQEFTDAVNALVMPALDLKQVTAVEAIMNLRDARVKANPRGLPLRLILPLPIGPNAKLFDLKLEGGSLRDALALITSKAGLQYKISPLYAYYLNDDGVSFRLHPHLTTVICTMWPPGSPEGMISRVILISDAGMRLLHLQPGPSGDVKEGLEKWGIQFPPGAFATCKPEKMRPGQNDLTVSNTADQVAQILNLDMAAFPDNWTQAVAKSVQKTDTGGASAPAAVEQTNRAKLIDKVNTLVLPKFEFNQGTVTDALQGLTHETIKADPDHQGIAFVLRTPAPTIKIDLKFENAPLKDILNSIANQTHLQYTVEDYAVYLHPAVNVSESLTVRTYLVPAGLLASISPASGSGTSAGDGGVDIQAQLAKFGIRFPVGAKAIFLPESGKMVVRNTPEQLDAVATLIDHADAHAASPTNSNPNTKLENISPSPDFNYAARAQTADAFAKERRADNYLVTPSAQNTTNLVAQEQPAAPSLAQPDANAAESTLDQRLRSIVLSLDLNNATIEEATNFLAIESKRLSPDHKQIGFIIDPEALNSAKPVTLTLNKVPYGEALRYICKLANVKFRLQDNAIEIVPATAPDVLPAATQPVVADSIAPPSDKSKQAIADKLKSIIIPSVNFNKLDVVTVLQFLAARSKELDPDKKGINFVLADLSRVTPQDHVHREVSVTLDNVPLEDLLGYVTQQTNLKWSIQDNAVYFAPAGTPSPSAPASEPASTQPLTSQGTSHVQFVGYQQLNGTYLFQFHLKDVPPYEQPVLKKTGDKLDYKGYVIGDFHLLFKDEVDPVTHATVKTDESTLELIQPEKGLKIIILFRREVELPE